MRFRQLTSRRTMRFSIAIASAVACLTQAQAADRAAPPVPAGQPPAGWTFQATPYSWLPWLSGNATLKGRNLGVQLAPSQVLDALDWRGIPAWMSYLEARNGQFGIFVDVIYSKVAGSQEFARFRQGSLLSLATTAQVRAESSQLVVEFGGAYEIWRSSAGRGNTSIDVLAGGRYWRQSVAASAAVGVWADLSGLTVAGGRAIASSGNVEWIDPLVGFRLRHDLAPAQRLTLRGDVGGFGAGSRFSWHSIVAYEAQLARWANVAVDGYIGYKALSVDYSRGSGSDRYQYNVVQHGPVVGLSVRF